MKIFLEEGRKPVSTPKVQIPQVLSQQELLVMVRGRGSAVAHLEGDKGWWKGGRIVLWARPRKHSVNKAVNKQRISICPDCYQHLPSWRQLPAMWPWFPVYPEGRVTTKAGALGACGLSDFQSSNQPSFLLEQRSCCCLQRLSRGDPSSCHPTTSR